MRGPLRVFPVLFLALGLFWPGTVFSAPPASSTPPAPPSADSLETCDPSPWLMEEGSLSRPVGAETDRARRDVRLETTPSQSVVQGPKSIPQIYGCKRTFLYRGKLRPTDSFNRQDAEKLRPVLSSVSEALNDLETYQRNRRRIAAGAYLGTAGLLVTIGSIILSNQYSGDTQRQVRAIGVLSGLTIGVGSAIYSLAILRTNESYLQRAADKYNRARPEDPLVLQFSTGILF